MTAGTPRTRRRRPLPSPSAVAQRGQTRRRLENGRLREQLKTSEEAVRSFKLKLRHLGGAAADEKLERLAKQLEDAK